LLLRALYTNWLAKKLKWESTFRMGILINSVWMLSLVIINVLIILIAPYLFIEFGFSIDEINSIYVIVGLLVFILNVIMGIFIVHSFYMKEYWGSLTITIIVVISERIIRILLYISFLMFFGLIFTEGFFLFIPF
jgi:hypothetical protein